MLPTEEVRVEHVRGWSSASFAPDRVVDLTRRQRAALGEALRETTGFVTASGG